MSSSSIWNVAEGWRRLLSIYSILTTGKVYPRTSRFSEQQDTVRVLKQSEAATSQRTAVRQKKVWALSEGKKSFFYEVEGF